VRAGGIAVALVALFALAVCAPRPIALPEELEPAMRASDASFAAIPFDSRDRAAMYRAISVASRGLVRPPLGGTSAAHGALTHGGRTTAAWFVAVNSAPRADGSYVTTYAFVADEGRELLGWDAIGAVLHRRE
jgi:hypothetical protein